MEIIYLGHSCFVLKSKQAKLITDPFGKSVGFTQAKTEADIVTISHDQHNDHNDLSQVTGEPRVVKGVGEYEIKGVMINGIASHHDDAGGKDRGKNVIYLMEMEDVKICHLGDLGHKLTDLQLKELDDVDVLMVPVGGVYTIDAKVALEVVKQINPSIVIPMHYQTKQHNDTFKDVKPVEEFISASQMEAKKLDKLVVKETELPEELELVVLNERI